MTNAIQKVYDINRYNQQLIEIHLETGAHCVLREWFCSQILYIIFFDNCNFPLKWHTMWNVIYAIQVFLIFFVVHVLSSCFHNLDRVMTEEDFAGWTIYGGKCKEKKT